MRNLGRGPRPVTRLLVAGAGLIGSRHAAHIAEHPDLTLAGVIEPDPALRAAFDAPGFASLADCDAEADGIVIATPTQFHEPVFLEAAARGLHALVEKPLAPDLAAVDRMIEAARKAGVHILTGHHRRFHPRVAALKDVIASGAIGQPILASLIWAVRKPDPYFEVTWRQSADGAPVRLNLCHEIDLLRHLFGEVTGVAGLGANPVRQTARVESGGAVLAFASGLTATIAFADTTPSPWGFEHGTGENPNIATTGQDSLRITGTEGAVEFPSLRVWTGAEDWSQAPAPHYAPAPDGVPLIRQLEHFAAVCRGETQPLNDAASGRRTLKLTLAVEAATLPSAP
ncbi:Gfo/Idh/MocA family protein [Silicimonas algicola]|uniref:Putative dehydrogenase n=1 Tax=Silicimonas algicola TaxID=1826607 RepID=A0A316G446_9RHOB|nr:Gfo/Idh/MocA family oxidoreductase [Silicimonas algicola]PWK55453.1 putative dehydrogenase [Silicimonas algicola]